MAEAPNRKRKSRMVTLDHSTVDSALKVAKKRKPPITKLSPLIDIALAEWTERNKSAK